jgi:hypothetical protein
MSNQKKFETLNKGRSVVDGFKGMDTVRKINYLAKNSTRFQSSDNNYETMNSYGFGQQGYFQLNGQFIKNIVMQIKLAAGTYVVPNAWGANIIDELRIREPGESERIIKGIHNSILSLREIEKNDIRDAYVVQLGSAATNPTAEVEAFIMLNILHSSMNPYLSQYYPKYATKDPIQVTVKFNTAALVLTSGTTTISDVKIHFELGEYEDPKPLMSHLSMGSKMGKIIEKTFGYEYIPIDNQPLNNGSVSRTIRIPTFEVAEYDELVALVVLDTAVATNNYLYGQTVSNKQLLISTREIINERGNYHNIKALMRYEKPLSYSLDSASRYIQVFDLAPNSYVHQNKSGLLHAGVVLSNETIILKFDTPTSGNSTCYLFAVRKVLRTFDGAVVKRYN